MYKEMTHDDRIDYLNSKTRTWDVHVFVRGRLVTHVPVTTDETMDQIAKHFHGRGREVHVSLKLPW